MHWIRGEELGRGGFAFVSKGVIQQEDSSCLVVAVKSSKSSECKSLVKEKKLLDRFNNCPFIIRCFGDETSQEDGQELYNIFLEYASGGCLAGEINKSSNAGKGLPEPLVKKHTRSILVALSHMHAMGYVHCDIKPHNILIVKEAGVEDTAKLADLGSALNMRGRGGEDEDDDDGGFRGTVLYAAPESISNQTYVPQSDVWSLGCTVLSMLTGNNSPWKFDKSCMNAVDVMMKIGCSDQIPEMPRKLISKEAMDFLKKCFVKDPTSRCTAHVLLDHPFIKAAPLAGRCSSSSRRHHHHHHLASRLFHGISSLVPTCFHLHHSAAVS
ncbi:mitogen-activated protein kinase kinase kinase 20-like [Henckelia pumila]|uniref:mitogen-activated protein kinase kinase kinase 20-like n=1 Tax=Henckelia pumila TaxID=405737 RepID=UPI003C6E3299